MELWRRLSDDARQAVVTAHNLARNQGCNEITAEHIGLGILAHPDCIACALIRAMGVDAQHLRDALTEATAGYAMGGPAPLEMEFTATARRCLQMAEVEARNEPEWPAGQGGEAVVTTGHLLLGLISPSTEADLKVLRAHGVFYGEVRALLRRMRRGGDV